MTGCKTLRDRQLTLLLEIESLMLGKTPHTVDVPLFRPHPPQTPPSRKRIASRRRANTAEITVRGESNADTDRHTPTPSTNDTSKMKRKAGTDHLLRTNSDPKIREWLKKKRVEMRHAQREKRRNEKERRSEADAKARAREERAKVAQEKYIEWSVKKLGELQEIKQRKRERCNSVVNDGVTRATNDKAYNEWVAKKKMKERQESKKDVEGTTKSMSEKEKQQRYDDWLKSKRRLHEEKVKRTSQQNEEKQRCEDEEKKAKEEEKARRLSYDDWLKKKRDKQRETARERKLELEKDGHVDEINPFSDVARDLRMKRHMEKEMMRKRVHTGITRPKVERRLNQASRQLDATEFLGEYVEQLQMAQLEQEDAVKPPVKVAWRCSSQRPEPQGSEAPEPVSATSSTGANLSLVCVSVQRQDCSQAVPDLCHVIVNGDRNGTNLDCTSNADHSSLSGDTSPMTNVV